jgi:hypothetical protein
VYGRRIRVALLSALLCGCTANGTPDLEITAAAPLAIALEPSLPALADGVPRNADLRVIFADAYPDPDTAVFGAILLRSGKSNFDVQISVDLAGRAIVLHPRSLLAPSTTYELVLSKDVRALDGRTLPESGLTLMVSVSGDVAAPPAAPADRVVWVDPTRRCDEVTSDTPIKQVGCILRTCAPACHSPSDALGDSRAPARGLDLTIDDPAVAGYGLVRVRASGQVDPTAPLDRVTPGDSARSVVLRKLLGGDAHLVTGESYPQSGVVGRRMPLPTQEIDPVTHQRQPSLPLSDEAVRLIQRWIDEGAPTE